MAILSFYPTLPSSLSSPKHPQRVLPHLAFFPPSLSPLTSHLSLLPKHIMHTPSSRDPHVTRTSALIDPDGGALVELVAPPSDRDALRQEASTLPSVSLKQIDIEWVHVLSEGWASPLRGFMRENEYLQCLHFNCLKMEDGSVVNMSLPIVLSITDQEKEAIGVNESVALFGPSGRPVAVLRRCYNL
jgi:3'-phosphoadenosine 5'-phosphosulfate synthase